MVATVMILLRLIHPLGCAESGSQSLCQDGDLNSGHEDFQSSALPTELSRRLQIFAA